MKEESSASFAAMGGGGEVGGELVITNVTKYVGHNDTRQCVLSDCSIEIEQGKLTVFIGPSGCGKTTLINLIAGYEFPDSGSIFLDGSEIKGPGSDRLVVFQETALFPWMTTWENISYGPQVHRKHSQKEISDMTNTLLKMVGLQDFKDKYPSQLSGGMQRRAELARAMINQPKVMLMDESFRGLDAMTRKLMQEYYVRIFEETGRTNIFVTSELDEAIFLADKLVILTNRPAKVKKIIPIDLPRPRSFSMFSSAEYAGYKREALELLHEEALRSFASGSVDAHDFISAYAATAETAECAPRNTE